MTVGSDYANTEAYNLSTDLNVTPYYDDYEDKKEYYRILYKPGFAVQGRELTQMQTILQKQITRFGRHIFQEGTIVIPGNFQLFANSISSTGPLNYVKIKDVDNSNNNITLSNFDGVILRGAESNVTAQVSIVADGTDTSSITKTLYVDYLSVDLANTNLKTFKTGEVLLSNVGNVVVLSSASNPIGKGSVFRISEGVLFAKEHFIYFPQQEVILDRYSDNPTAKVGFNIVENIVDYTLDSSLLDPALESSNYSAPGGDRLRLSAVLESRAFDDTTGAPDFTTLFTIKDSVIQTYNQRTQYSILKDELAKRTFDESGDYYVSGLDVELRETADSGTNGGLVAPGPGIDANTIAVRISPGTAYVKGYEVQATVAQYLTTPKSLNFTNVNSQIVSAFMGSYVTANNMVGHLELDEGTEITLLDTFNRRISDGRFTAAPLGNTIGTATVMSVEYNNGILGTPDGRADIYLSDIRMRGQNTFSSVKSLYINTADNNIADFGADIVPDIVTNNTVLREPFNAPLLYYTGSNFTRKIGDGTNNDISDTTYYYTTTIPVTITESGTYGTFTASVSGANVPYTGTLSTTDKREIFLSLESSVNVAIGNFSSNDKNVITGSGTTFRRLTAGEKIQFTGVGHSNTYTVLTTPTSDTELQLAEPVMYLTPAPDSVMYRHYGAGSYIDLTSYGMATGTPRSVSVITGTQTLQFNLGETFPASTSAAVSFRISRKSAIQTEKTLRRNRYVKIDCSTAGTTGPYDLGFSDVYKIKTIVKKSTGGYPTSNTDGTIVTSQFIFNNGQKDTLYDLATIRPTTSLTSADRLLVELDYFVPDFSIGRGFFTVNSYPIPELDYDPTEDQITTAEIPIYKSPSSGKKYDLRNYIDFRPVKSLTANDITDPASGSVTINPGKSNTFNFVDSSLAIPSPSSEIFFDYSYYVARKDIVSVNKNRVFSIIQGEPGSLPVTPQIPENELGLAQLTIAPFPSISPYYAKLIGRQDIACAIRKIAPVRHTMRDIGVMKSRIANLEYYASLSLLEKSAADMQIQDENNLDRFKNGIFVDTFRNHTLGDTTNGDYRIVVDPAENSIRPLYSMQSINYDYLSGSNVKKTNDIVTLDYYEVEYANVSSVTATINTEKSSYAFIGNMTITPDSDIWIDPKTLTPQTISFENANLDGLQDAQQQGGVTTTWNSWQTAVTGYKVYQGTGGVEGQVLIGEYSSYDEAYNQAQNIRTTSLGATIETSYQNSRTGSESYTFVDNDSVSTGSKVVSTEIVPYIRPQVLVASVNGIKPYAKYKVFFDNIDMSAYVRPITYQEYINYNTLSPIFSVGDDLLANAEGQLWFRLTLPDSDSLRFTVGSKVLKITDSMTNTSEETSYASKTFFAQGMIETKQETILSTRQVDVRTTPLPSQTNDYNTFSTLPALVPPPQEPAPQPPEPVVVEPPVVVVDPPVPPPTVVVDPPLPPYEPPVITDPVVTTPTKPKPKKRPTFVWPQIPNNKTGQCCLAYVMPIKVPGNEEGVFLTAVEIYCAEKHPTLGMWCEVRELDAGGGITKNAVPFSAVWFRNVEVPISTDGKTNGLKVSFEAPIFLYANKSYAFVIHPEAANSNYYFWMSRIGQNDINTGQPVNSRAYTGTTFTTNNNTIWVLQDQIDLTCKWYRAAFRTEPGIFELGNKPKEKFYMKDIVGSLEGFGEPFVTGERLTFTGATGTPVVGDFIVGTTSTTNGTVISVSSGTYKTSNIRFTSSEPVTILDGTTGSSKGTATISAISRGTGYLEYYNNSPTKTQMILTNSNGGFSTDEILFDISDEGYGTIESIENQRYSVIDFEPAVINFADTSSTYEMAVSSNTNGSGRNTYFNFDAGENYIFDDEKAIFSRSNEIADLSSGRSNKIKITLSTDTNYVSPVFDLSRTQSIIVDNLINSDVTGENETEGGQLFNKYISKIITLSDFQDAEDMNVFLTAYRPPTTDVKVWIKLLNGEDSDPMAQVKWIEMEKTYGGDVTYSSIANKNDFKEYKFVLPATSLDELGVFTYLNTANIPFKGFKSFQIKIGLLGCLNDGTGTLGNSAVVPRVADLRTIALQV